MLVSSVYAQEAVASKPPASSLFSTFFPFIIVFVIFYILIFRPQQKQQKQKKLMLAGLKRGDDVVTAGGIHGKVVDLADDVVSLQIATNVIVKMERAQVSVVKTS